MINFVTPQFRSVACSITDLHIQPNKTLAMQAQCTSDPDCEDPLVEGGCLRKDSLFVARVLTKVAKSVEWESNSAGFKCLRQKCFSSKGSELHDLEPFMEVSQPSNTTEKVPTGNSSPSVLTESYIDDISHVNERQREKMLNLLSDVDIS